MDKTYEKIAIFLPFLNSCFYNLRRLFLFSEYRQTHFPGAVCAKKEKNHGLIPLEKSQFFDFFNFLFSYSKKGFSPFLE